MLDCRFSGHYGPSSRPLTTTCHCLFPAFFAHGDPLTFPKAANTAQPYIGRNLMALERSDVEKIADLARLGLNEADIPGTTETLNNILGLIDQMQAVNTDGIEPLAHPLEATQRLRADQVTERNQRDAYQAIAPAVENGLYLVPQVIE